MLTKKCLLSMEVRLLPIYVGSMSVCLKIPNFAFVSIDHMIFPNTILACRLIFFYVGWIIEPILVILKIEYRLSRRLGGGRGEAGGGVSGEAYAASQTIVLHMKRLNQTESPSFMILCVLCFQRQSHLILIRIRTRISGHCHKIIYLCQILTCF